MELATRIYRWLVRTYPARFSSEYGDEMLQLFADQLADARARRRTGRFLLSTARDWIRTVVAEHLADSNRAYSPPPFHSTLRRVLVFAPNIPIAVFLTTLMFVYRGLRISLRPRISYL